MKKFVSSLLIFSTLFAYVVPVNIGCAAGGKHISAEEIALSNQIFSDLAKDKEFKKEFSKLLSEALLELSKNKKFDDQIVKNYEKAHEDPLWFKLLKLPFKIVKIGGKIVLKIFDYTIGYWVGEKVCKFLEDCAFLGVSLLIIKKYYISADTLDKWIKFPGDLKQKLNKYTETFLKKFSL